MIRRIHLGIHPHYTALPNPLPGSQAVPTSEDVLVMPKTWADLRDEDGRRHFAQVV
jgi:hypothetical protein